MDGDDLPDDVARKAKILFFNYPSNPTPPISTHTTPYSSNPAFDVLNDSDDLYDHDYNFLAIKEQNENLEMLKYVNNIK